VQVQAEITPCVLPNTTVYPFKHNLLSSLPLKKAKNINISTYLENVYITNATERVKLGRLRDDK
jgi:hypothetical protein